jgi:tetratricopeptide (TPR) repeat protein
MKIFAKILLASFLVSCLSPVLLAHPVLSVRKGIKLLNQGKLEQAETELRKSAFEKPEDPLAKYNLGQVRYRKRDYESALLFFSEAAKLTEDESLRFKSLHNKGNSAYRMHDFASAVDAYEQALKLEQNPETEHNLEQAKKRLEDMLKKQMEKEQNQSESPENQQQKQKSDKNSESSSKNQQGDQGEHKEDGNKSDSQQQNQKDSQAGKNDEGKEPSDKQQSDKQQSDSSQPGDEQKSESQKSSDAEDENKNGQKSHGERQDVEMAQPEEKNKKPDASQRARALKNKNLNPYMVEKILKQLQEREKQAQLHYRNETTRRDDEIDPFDMNARQLHEFFQNRHRRRPGKKSDEPDW